MGSVIEALCSVQTWLYAGIMTVGVVGLAKSWVRFRDKYTEKMAAKEAEEKK